MGEMSPGTALENLEREQARRALSVLWNEQTRLMLAQNAASLGRLAAAISHEMNTPLGALRSAVDTFETIVARNGTNPDTRVAAVQQDLLRAIRESANRLSRVVERMQRFTNLNRAEVQRTCVNGLISDVVGLLDPDIRARVRIILEQMAGLPYVVSHPQQLTAVFSMVVNNAIDSVGVDGQIRIVTRSADRTVHIEVHDNGRGIPAHALGEVFEPSFGEQSGRVASTNWNLFSCRHLIEAHGGEIHISSAEGEGTTVHIALPAEPSAHG
jgi:signal transduction histidine kinase